MVIPLRGNKVNARLEMARFTSWLISKSSMTDSGLTRVTSTACRLPLASRLAASVMLLVMLMALIGLKKELPLGFSLEKLLLYDRPKLALIQGANCWSRFRRRP